MSMYVVKENCVDVIGKIWEPGTGVCYSRYALKVNDIRSMGQDITRASVLAWLLKHAGDFCEIIDFRATIDAAGVEIPFSSEESESILYSLVG